VGRDRTRKRRDGHDAISGEGDYPTEGIVRNWRTRGLNPTAKARGVGKEGGGAGNKRGKSKKGDVNRFYPKGAFDEQPGKREQP